MLGFKIKNRVSWLAIAMIAIFAVITAQLFRIQIIDHDTYREQAEAEAIKQLVVPAQRGLIYMRDMDNFAPVVLNEQVFLAFVDPMVVADAVKVEDVLKKVAGGNLTVSNLADMLREGFDAGSRYIVVARGLSRAQAEMIKAENLTGVGFTSGTRRVYPEGNLASQTLGFMNGEGVGQYGIEQALNERLSGKDGLLQTVTDINNVPLTIGDKNIREPAVDGENIVLTIDRNIQALTEKALKSGMEKAEATRGSALVMNPRNGEILAMANLPDFSPAEFDKVEDASLFQNAVVMDPYEPGSVTKAFTMAAGLDSGAVRPDSTYNNTDYIQVEDRQITNAHKGYLGTMTMQDVLNQSLNTGVVTVLMRMGESGDRITSNSIDKLFGYFDGRFHFGRLTGVEVAENPGVVVSPKEVEGNAVRYSNMTFGQGMNVNMLTMANSFSALVNGGKLWRPTVVAGTIDADSRFAASGEPEPLESEAIKLQTSVEIQEMLTRSRATAFAVQDTGGQRTGGKTGTSEVLVDGSYTKSVTVASYLGFVGGSADPNASDFGANYVIMIRLAADGKNLEGGLHAAPVFAEISNQLQGF